MIFNNSPNCDNINKSSCDLWIYGGYLQCYGSTPPGSSEHVLVQNCIAIDGNDGHGRMKMI